MRHRSTPLATALGGAALLFTAVAWGSAVVRYDAVAPRLDILVPLALAALLAVGWLLAVRAAPPVEQLPAAAAREGIPATLGTVRRDWGHVGAAYLTVWAPFAAARAAYGEGGSVFGSAYCGLTLFFGVVMSLYATGLLTDQLGAAQRMLKEDAAAGSVHAVRVRFGTPVREEYRRPTGMGVGSVMTTSSYYVDLLPEGGADGQDAIRLKSMSGDNFRIPIGEKHLSHAAAQLSGHTGWLCWPTRWKDIAGTDKQRRLSAAFVADTGHVVWGLMAQQDWESWLRDDAAPVRETDTGLAVEPLPRPSRFRSKVHARTLLIAAVAALTAVPYLVGAVPYGLGLALGAVAGVLALVAGGRLGIVGVQKQNMDPELWTVRHEAHPSLR
ncbi:hypothetical protein [Streptomyces sp. NBC_01235]|uniref:hypothetical protein n=1 Tax=Streptomyces sp. NBC_01235 TaxID=2903788 RepID=UPI002E13141B|nr:hypothetical protein OG289_34655 [Streptomyces sp. NBC_01235]